MTKIKTESN